MSESEVAEYGKGAIPLPPEIAATKYRLAAEAPRLINWSVPFSVENGFTLRQRNQKSSLSCTGQGTAYYCEALNHTNGKDEVYSARHIYSQIHLPDGGAYITDAMRVPLIQGSASLTSVPEGDSSESVMRDRSLNAQAVLEARADKYAMIPNNRSIDSLAGIIEDYGGFVTGFSGRNDMFLPDGTVQNLGGWVWGHCVFVCGYEMRNGIKCLKFKNSWSEFWGDHGYGYFPEDFVNRGPLFDAYVYADILDLDPMSVLLTKEDVAFLQALEGFSDPMGQMYWTGKTLKEYKSVRVPDKIRELQKVLPTQ